jgi:hypothetical protein
MIEIIQVLWSSTRLFVHEQFLPPDIPGYHRLFLRSDYDLQSPFPCLGKTDAINLIEKIDAVRRTSKLQNQTGLFQLDGSTESWNLTTPKFG